MGKESKVGYFSYPAAGTWIPVEDSEKWYFAFKCRCDPKCPGIYVGIADKFFDLRGIETVEDLIPIYEGGIDILLSPELTLMASKTYTPSLWKNPEVDNDIGGTIRFINAMFLGGNKEDID
jgi:hypothetical protein